MIKPTIHIIHDEGLVHFSMYVKTSDIFNSAENTELFRQMNQPNVLPSESLVAMQKLISNIELDSDFFSKKHN